MLKKGIIYIFVMILLQNCILVGKLPKGWKWYDLRPISGTENFPPADTDYGMGFRDGCGMAWDAVSKGLTSDITFQDFKPEMAENQDYQTGWFDGFEQCTYIEDWDVV